ncbi:MAG: Clp protease ClpP [Ruminococcaceae bacterium]|nr:Clp protease ClpP [Oscillospiraceae bacterium]
MAKVLNLEYLNPKTRKTTTGKMEIKNQTSKTAELYFYGDIVSSTWDAWQEEDRCPQDVADFLNSLDGMKDIDIFINSGGGDAFAGLAMHNILKRNAAFKISHVDGLAASAASLLALSGDKIIMPSGAQIMIHDPWMVAQGNAADFRRYVEFLDKMIESYAEVYTECLADGSNADIRAMMHDEKWMTGSEAAQIFKGIQTEDMQAAACKSDFFSFYKHPDAFKNPEKPEQKPQDGEKEQIEAAKAKLSLACLL